MPFAKGGPNPRRGNGAGWGGAAKGEGSREPGPGRGHTHRSVAELMAQANAREIAADRWLAILNDPNHPHHATMVVKAAERMDGAPIQRQDVTSGGERMGFVIAAPAEIEDSDEWAKLHSPKPSK